MTTMRGLHCFTLRKFFPSLFCAALLVRGFWPLSAAAEWLPATRPLSSYLGVWQGFASGRPEYYRLDIRGQGSASLVMDEDSLGVTVYQIRDWHLRKGEFYATAHSLRNGLEMTNHLEVALRSVGGAPSFMVVDIECSTEGWKRQVTFYSQQLWSNAPRRALNALKAVPLRRRGALQKRAN